MFVFIINLVVLISVVYLLSRKEKAHRSLFWFGCVAKTVAGILIGLLYFFYYRHGDTIDFFSQAEKLSELAHKNFAAFVNFLWSSEISIPGYEGLSNYPARAIFFSKWAAIFALITDSNYWLMSCYFSLISFMSSWFLVKQITKIFPGLSFQAFFSLFFFPSVVIWSSGLIKESLAMAALFFIVIIFLRIWNREKVSAILWVVLFLAGWMLWRLKYYYLGVLLPVMVTELIMKWIVDHRLKLGSWTYIALWLVIFIGPGVAVSFVHPNFNLQRLTDVVVSNHDLIVSLSQPGDIIHYNSLTPQVADVVVNLPKALFSGLFRPLPWEAGNLLQILAAFENSILVILFAGLLLARKRNQHGSKLWFGVMVYCVILCALLALSTPNLGTLSRFKVGFLPFLVILITSENIFIDKLKELLQRKWKHLV